MCFLIVFNIFTALFSTWTLTKCQSSKRPQTQIDKHLIRGLHTGASIKTTHFRILFIQSVSSGVAQVLLRCHVPYAAQVRSPELNKTYTTDWAKYDTAQNKQDPSFHPDSSSSSSSPLKDLMSSHVHQVRQTFIHCLFPLCLTPFFFPHQIQEDFSFFFFKIFNNFFFL